MTHSSACRTDRQAVRPGVGLEEAAGRSGLVPEEPPLSESALV